MQHLKGTRFGCGFVQRISHISDRETHRIGWNAHDGCEVHYVLKGCVTWETRRHASCLSVPGGSFAVIPPHVSHRAAGELGSPSERIGVIYRAGLPEPGAPSALDRDDLSRLFARLESHAFAPHPLTSELAHTLREIRKALDAFDPGEPDSRLQLRLLNEQLLFQTAAAIGNETVLGRYDRVIPEICRWIDGHTSEGISTDDLVRRSGYSRSRFFSLFLAETGLTPRDYIVRRRLDAARALLKSKRRAGESIAEIAKRCGFASAANFSIAFRRHYGRSPSEFSRQS